MKKKWWLLLTALLLLGSILSWTAFQRAHTFTLSGSEEKKNEQIQPLFQTVKVSGDCDTDVVFTDTETGEEYLIGYITHGVSQTIQLPADRWYTVEGAGNLRVGLVEVRIE